MAFSIHRKILFGFCLVLTVSGASNAQFTFSGQLRTRTEYRNGQGTVLKEADKAAFFTSQRTRISAAYAGYRIPMFRMYVYGGRMPPPSIAPPTPISTA
ncbi:MAG: hypothetical protein LH609_20535 [Rudanella sp.]|nr:hypothetical protein [Rudanella sp.]